MEDFAKAIGVFVMASVALAVIVLLARCVFLCLA
jgi:cbb3-type cytochrome oxidase subunit 3